MFWLQIPQSFHQVGIFQNQAETLFRSELQSFPGSSEIKNQPANAGDAGDVGSIPGLEDSLKVDMATHSSILAWEIPWTEEPGRLQSMGSQKSQIQPSNQTTNNKHVTDPLCKEEGRSNVWKNKRGQIAIQTWHNFSQSDRDIWRDCWILKLFYIGLK